MRDEKRKIEGERGKRVKICTKRGRRKGNDTKKRDTERYSMGRERKYLWDKMFPTHTIETASNVWDNTITVSQGIHTLIT